MGPGSKFLRTNLEWFEANWILELNSALDPSLHLSSSTPESSLLALCVFQFKPIDLPSKMVPCRFSLDLSLLGLGASSKNHGSDIWPSYNRIALCHWTSEHGLSSQVALRWQENSVATPRWCNSNYSVKSSPVPCFNTQGCRLITFCDEHDVSVNHE